MAAVFHFMRLQIISEKTGMRLVGAEMRDYFSGRWPSEIWEIAAKEWRDIAGHSRKNSRTELGERA